MGNILFCITLDGIEKTQLEEENQTPIYQDLSITEEEISAIPEEYDVEALSTPGTNTLINENFYTGSAGTRNKKHIIRDTILCDSFQLEGRNLNNWTLMYIDDLNIGEVLPLETAQRHITEKKEVKNVHARFCENAFDNISANANKIGMQINEEKTQLLCVSDPRQSEIIAHIDTEDKRIQSVSKMKILGFVFGKDPNVTEHVNYIVQKFNKSLWMLIHLKRAGIREEVLLEVFKVTLRPILEYCAPIYGPMLTNEQIQTIERQQKRALKIIYGFNLHYEDILAIKGLSTQEERRNLASQKFAQKLLITPRFQYLFPENVYPEEMAELRNKKKYKEFQAKTDRLYKSPLYTMRRYLNDIY